MLFNREEEVQRYYNAQGRWSKSGSHAEGGNSPALDALLAENTGEPAIAERIGVLADIMVLDQITGQRLTHEAIEFSKKWALVRDEDGNVSPEEPITSERQQSLLNANLTNSAFLIPNPIRVIFSENFMVDGYVNTVAVTLQKFSPDMVPTVCVVDISMHALYQGFARRSTVFTTLAGLKDDDAGVIVGNGAFDEESENAEAAVVGSTEETLQLKGLVGTPILAGFDWSPHEEPGIFDADRGSLKMSEWQARAGINYTDHLPLTGVTDKHPPKGGRSLKAQLRDTGQDAITFGIVSNLMDSSLGEFIRSNGGTEDDAKEWFKRMKPNLRVRGYVGLSLRARLKASTQASLKVLWEDGDENGFTTFAKAVQTYDAATGKWETSTTPDAHFFDRWSTEQRRLLFAAGIDNFSRHSGTSTTAARREIIYANSTANQTSGFFTRSFPILEVSPGYYGDNFSKSDFEYNSSAINLEIGDNLDEGWIWCGTKDNPQTIPSENWYFDIANGFYNDSGVPFPDELYLRNKTTDAILHTYTIQYQQALTLRVRMEVKDSDSAASDSNGYVPVSDTGVLLIYPRSLATGIIDDVDGAGVTDRGVHDALDLSGRLRGDEGTGIEAHMKDGYWLEGQGSGSGITSRLFYDGLFQHQGKNGFDQNMKQYGLAYNREDPGAASLGGTMISSKDTLRNNILVSFSDGL
jgi:hypothetical protein